MRVQADSRETERRAVNRGALCRNSTQQGCHAFRQSTPSLRQGSQSWRCRSRTTGDLECCAGDFESMLEMWGPLKSFKHISQPLWLVSSLDHYERTVRTLSRDRSLTRTLQPLAQETSAPLSCLHDHQPRSQKARIRLVGSSLFVLTMATVKLTQSVQDWISNGQFS